MHYLITYHKTQQTGEEFCFTSQYRIMAELHDFFS